MKPFTYKNARKIASRQSLEEFLRAIANRNTGYGGGSVVALNVAMAAALMEKLSPRRDWVTRCAAIRCECLRLVQEDADVFSKVILAFRKQRIRLAYRQLKGATKLQCRVFQHARRLEQMAQTAKESLASRLQSDLCCVIALARAAQTASRELILTNISWVNERPYSRKMRQWLRRLS